MKPSRLVSKLLSGGTLAAFLTGSVSSLDASSFSTFVGYADGLRSGPFYPSPWFGDNNVIFDGLHDAGMDAGALRIDNTGGSAFTVSSVTVTLRHGLTDYVSFSLWSPHVVAPGERLILTETAHYNFDTSDYGDRSVGDPYPNGLAGAARIEISIAGDPLVTLFDTGHILSTGGFDYAALGNESFGWRPIGGAGVDVRTNVPDSSGLSTLMIAGFGLAGWYRLNRRAQAA